MRGKEQRCFLNCKGLSLRKCSSFCSYRMTWQVMGWAGVLLGMENGNHLALVPPDC